MMDVPYGAPIVHSVERRSAACRIILASSIPLGIKIPFGSHSNRRPQNTPFWAKSNRRFPPFG